MKVGFFLHTPFPSSEIYRTLPVREEVRGGKEIQRERSGMHRPACLASIRAH